MTTEQTKIKKIAIIMAGGSGERFWPLSRALKPKQLLKLTDSGITMIEEAIERIIDIINEEDIFIITSEKLVNPIKSVLQNYTKIHVEAEPNKRNTAPCLVFAAGIIKKHYKIASDKIAITVLTADHIIKPKADFAKLIDTTLNYVIENQKIVTIGIKPTRPETGYGYIMRQSFDKSINGLNYYTVEQFKEKPNYETAKQYVEDIRYYWNAGMFFYNLEVFESEYERCNTKMLGIVNEMSSLEGDELRKRYDEIEPTSIDYGLMEKSDKICLVESNFDWDDVGTLDSIYRTKKMDSNKNIIQDGNETKDCIETIIINEMDDDTVVTAVGLEGIIIIATKKAILVCNKNNAQDVKAIIEKLKEKNRMDIL